MQDDIRIVALEQMVTRDRTLNDAFDLDYGYSMDRDFIGGKWIRTKLDVEENE
ncbi:hypothetical protein QTN47_20565 [Danxiaibacter flavus]|uniref:Uncharacterized protein n=1 Tax=Danxiaibacter flavus TaxID=3049108 RepID=A0ABV3ZMX0_9BACT|nr:hypothetical protein QNM32_20570 [Chitinophagaceae bacterium DXS]